VDEVVLGCADQDAFALWSQQRAAAALKAGFFDDAITPVEITGKGGASIIDRDEHPRDTTLEAGQAQARGPRRRYGGGRQRLGRQ
jgi:acetyl-CoA acetyltransferase